MRKTDRKFWLAAVVCSVLVAAGYAAWDLYRASHQIQCPDGARHTIDLRDFQTRYSGYSAGFELALEKKGKLAGKLEPVQLQTLTEAAQQAGEFRKFLVAGYNSCAVSQQDFTRFGARYQTLDALARQIHTLSSAGGLDEAGKRNLAGLVEEYRAIVQSLR